MIGASLTLAPVVYVALERLLFVKVAAVVVLMVLAIWLAIDAESWRALPDGFSTAARIPDRARVRAADGRGGVRRRGRRSEPLSEQLHPRQGLRHGPLRAAAGQPGHRRRGSRADLRRASSSSPTPANMARWRRWWRFANVEQALTFVLVTIATIALTSMLAHSTLFGRPDLPNNVTFLLREGQELQAIVAPWFGVLFWAIGAFSLFATSMGIIDYTSRLAADVLKTTYLRGSSHIREPHLLPAGVGHGRARGHDHPERVQPAAGAAGDLGVHRRRDHVPVLVPADRAEPERAAGRRLRPTPFRVGDAGLVDALLRRAVAR